MPRVTISFKLPEENSEHRTAVNAGAWKSIAFEMSQFFRNKLKYGHDYKTADEALEAARDEFWNLCKEENLDPWQD